MMNLVDAYDALDIVVNRMDGLYWITRVLGEVSEDGRIVFDSCTALFEVAEEIAELKDDIKETMVQLKEKAVVNDCETELENDLEK